MKNIISMMLVVTAASPLVGFSFTWMKTYSIAPTFSLQLTTYSTLFMMTVMAVTFIVIKFSMYYMQHSANQSQFTWFTLAFVGSMLLLLMSNDWLTIIIAWEGLGITSFFLVAFYSSWVAHQGSIITMLTNRLGDITLMASVTILIVTNIKSITFHPMIIIMLLITMATKSAQTPFVSWLPAAMAAPTPISSLVHSSTLVTAGLIMWLKFEHSPLSNSTTSILGMTTLLVGSWAALIEKDLKRVVAFSTLSQLGLILLSMSLMIPLMSWFHLMTHAFFKSSLFIWVGSNIFKLSSNQDSSLFSSNANTSLNWASWAGVALVSLGALPLTCGYLSKESFSSLLDNLIILYAVSLTLLYAWRLAVPVLSLNQKQSHSSQWTNLGAIGVLLMCWSGISWANNLNIGPVQIVSWIVMLSLIPVFVWMNKWSFKIYYSITNLTKLNMNLMKSNEKMWYTWSWSASWISPSLIALMGTAWIMF